jgi:hypothetical protein
MSTVINTECSCGYTPDGAAYCGLFYGDSPAKSYLTQLQAWLRTSAVAECNTARRFKQDCYEAFWDGTNADKLTLYSLYFQNYPQLIDNSDCVKSIYTSSYWSLEQNSDNDEDDDDSGMWVVPGLTWLILS